MSGVATNDDSGRVIYLCHVCGQRWRWKPDSLQIDVSINGVAVEPKCPSCCYPLVPIGSSEP